MNIPGQVAISQVFGVLVVGLTLTACSAAEIGKSTVAVGVHGINYTNQTFSYIVKDPESENNSAGGELVNSFSSGGLMCCYSLPIKWHPGLKVIITSTHWLHEKVDGMLPQLKKNFTVDVPPYVDGQPGELWVIRNSDGSVSVVSSDYSPAHPKWPGPVKGWPVPSEEYRNEKRKIEIQKVEERVTARRKILREIVESPEKYTTRLWPRWQEWRDNDYLRFSGPADPLLHKYLKDEFESNIAADEEKLLALKRKE